ncbi:eCIS core domain-containing protein [Amantichitinum ursilacus]|uniref:eCIS core domain-containing protein n=1 Tax=Amantichitinum ursilacus TaxID=857265 RepID=A0A0N0XHC8_9NEIS|nr:DUF4157 domain-containing protein [Amantichitinum ursilacus]KPC51529.1 hypothetical protein WG78_15470 [Amantichitinum ursilacus]
MVDRAPSQVADAPATHAAARSLLLQRKCACGGNAGGGGECDSCAAAREQGGALQRHSHGPAASLNAGVPHSVTDTLSRPGRPLDADTRSFMESRFDSDFGSVRIHNDSAAAQSARDVSAHAYTVGNNVVFGDGQYQPHSDSGRHLLAHELAHTLQQQGLQRAGISNLADQGPDYQRMEHEADHAADHVMRGISLPRGLLSQGGLRLSRKADAKTKPPAPAATEAGATPVPDEKNPDKGPGFTVAYNTESRNRSFELHSSDEPVPIEGKVDKKEAEYTVAKLVLPPQKGPDALAFYKTPYRPLKTTFEWDGAKPRPADKFKIARDPTATLQKNWLGKFNYKTGKDADKRWNEVGGKKNFPEIPTGPTCQVDHIQELQVNGDNSAQNLQLLDAIDNGSSGSLIWQQISTLANMALADATATLGKKNKPKLVTLHFQSVDMQGAPTKGLCYDLGKRFADPSITKESGAPTIDFDMLVLGNVVKLKLPGTADKIVPFTGVNAGAANVLKGLTLVSIERDLKGKGGDRIHASIDAEKFRMKKGKPGGDFSMKLGPQRDLLLPKNLLGQPFTYEYVGMSPGKLTSLSIDGDGIKAEGTLKPSLPLLPELKVAIDSAGFKVTSALDPAKLKPPFPGVKVTEASLSVLLAPEFRPEGNLAFAFGGAKTVADLKLKATADANGLVLRGDLFVYVPGLDSTKGEVTYQGGEWSGGVKIETAQMAGKIPWVQSGMINVALAKGKIGATGEVQLKLPGDNPATLTVSYTNEKWLFKGQGRFDTKNKFLDPVDAMLSYDGEAFLVHGKTGVKFKGFHGTVDAWYKKKGTEESFWGTGEIDISKGRATGKLKIDLNPNGKVSGKGTLKYVIQEAKDGKQGMVADASVTMDQNQKITFEGDLTFPDITLFKRFPEKEEPHEIFAASGSFPVPGASIGPIGLKFKLYGSIGYYYYVGPGVLTGIKASVKFDPFEDNPDFSFSMRAKAVIPAGGGITGVLGADAVLDVLIGEVGGGISVHASAGLEGKAELASEIAYTKDRFSVDASGYIGGGLILAASLHAHLYAEAGVSIFKVRTEKDWELLGGKLDTGLSLGVRMPLHYDSVDGFRMPKLSDIKREPAELNIDTTDLIGRLLGKTTPKEVEK